MSTDAGSAGFQPAAGGRQDGGTTAPLLTRLAIAACAVSLAAALYALAYPRGCAACEASSMLGAGPIIPLLGSLWYAALLSLLIGRGLNRVTGLMAHIGVGVHIGLVCLMAQDRQWCIPCLAAALGAVLIAAAAWRARAVPWGLAVVAVVVTGCVSVVGLYLLSIQPRFKLEQELQKALAMARAHGPVAPGAVEMTYYKREGCNHCEAFDRDVLPALKQEFGDKLKVVEVNAWSGIPSPTLVIRGKHETVMYPDPALDEVRGVVEGELEP